MAGRRGGLSWAKDNSIIPERGSVSANEVEISNSYNVTSHVVPNDLWDANKGSKTPAFSKDGEIYFRENIPEENRGMVAEHEITHVMKQVGFRPYLDFIDRTADMLNMSNDFTRILLEDTANAARQAVAFIAGGGLPRPRAARRRRGAACRQVGARPLHRHFAADRA